jgi:ADP-ribosylglycohydrolase
MYVAAAISAAFVAKDPIEIFEMALKFVPQRSRFYEVMVDCLAMVKESSDWLKGYRKINEKYGEYGHCQLYQECGQLMNSAKFAENVSHAFCMQVAQGCDTDCFGEIIGSIMGAYFGPGHLEDRWLAPFNDDFRTSLGNFHERSLKAVTERMSRLPKVIAGDGSSNVVDGELSSETGI